MTDASPAQKRARTTESQASNAVPAQIYRVRVSLPSHSGTRLFDMPESASLHDLHMQICEAFNRDPTAHLFAYEYPLPVHAVAMHGPSGPKTDKDTVIFLCNACGVPTEGRQASRSEKVAQRGQEGSGEEAARDLHGYVRRG